MGARERFKWWYYRRGMVREMAAVIIMLPRHLSAQQQSQCAHVVVHACACENWCWNLKPPLPLSFPLSHFTSLQSPRSHCGSTGEQFVLIRTLPDESGEQSTAGWHFHITAATKRRREASCIVIYHSIISVFNTHAICTNSKLTSFWFMKPR